MNIKIISRLIILAMCLTLSAVSVKGDTWKVVERSEEKVPDWLNKGQVAGTMMVTAEASSLQEARRMAEQTLMRNILQAVATNVTSSSSQTDSNVFADGKVSTREEYFGRLEIAAAKLPFIKGVSLSEATGQYWERRENKQSKQNLYILTVLYPLPESELRRMREEFEALDRSKMEEYNDLEQGIATVGSVEDIRAATAALEGLEEYFFDSVRRTGATTLRQRYMDLYRMVTLTGEAVGVSSESSTTGEFILRTELRGKPFVTGKIPEVTSECASRIKVMPIEGGAAFRVTYSAEDCLPDEPNSLKATLRLNSARLATTLHF